MARFVLLSALPSALAAPGCDMDDGAQRMVWVPQCHGAGCLADGVHQACAWCVYDSAACTEVYGAACGEISSARAAEGISCTDATVSDAIFELDASQQQGSFVVDMKSHIEFGELPTTCADGVTFWDLDSATLTRSGGGNITEGQQYTHAFWIHWQPDRTYRTLFHHSKELPTSDHVGDHCEFTQSHSGQCSDCDDTLGVQCNRASPPWRRSEYRITTGVWSFVVSVGFGDDDSSPTGTTTFYAGGSDLPMKVGTSDRVCSGMSYDRVGWDNTQGPGKLAQVWGWNRTLSESEILEVYENSRGRYHGREALVV